MPTMVRPGDRRQGRPTRAPLPLRRRPEDAGNKLCRQPPPHARPRRRRGVLPEGARVGLLRRDPGQVADPTRSPQIGLARHRSLL